jgi:hypothetical protein
MFVLKSRNKELKSRYFYLAMLNFRYGAKARNMLKKHNTVLVQA